MYGIKPRFTETYAILASGTQTISEDTIPYSSEVHISVTGAGTVDVEALHGNDATYLKEATVIGGTGSIILDLLWVNTIKITETSGNAVSVTVVWG